MSSAENFTQSPKRKTRPRSDSSDSTAEIDLGWSSMKKKKMPVCLPQLELKSEQNWACSYNSILPHHLVPHRNIVVMIIMIPSDDKTATNEMSQNMRKQTFRHVPPTKTQISLCIHVSCPHEETLQNAPSKDVDQIAWMHRLSYILAGCTCLKVCFWCSGSNNESIFCVNFFFFFNQKYLLLIFMKSAPDKALFFSTKRYWYFSYFLVSPWKHTLWVLTEAILSTNNIFSWRNKM